MDNLAQGPGDRLRSLEERIFANSLEELEEKKLKTKWTGMNSQNIATDIFISEAVMTFLGN